MVVTVHGVNGVPVTSHAVVGRVTDTAHVPTLLLSTAETTALDWGLMLKRKFVTATIVQVSRSIV